jgi:hypothetical protein
VTETRSAATAPNVVSAALSLESNPPEHLPSIAAVHPHVVGDHQEEVSHLLAEQLAAVRDDFVRSKHLRAIIEEGRDFVEGFEVLLIARGMPAKLAEAIDPKSSRFSPSAVFDGNGEGDDNAYQASE